MATAIADQIIESYYETEQFNIPKGTPIGMLALLYGKLKEYIDEEDLENYLKAVDKYVHDIKHELNLTELSNHSHKNIEFINEWFDKCKWRDIINPNLTSNENTKFIIYVDLTLM